MAMIAMKMALPRSLEHVPVDRLISFRRRHMPELTAYQRFIHDLASRDGPLGGMTRIDDADVLESRLSRYYEKEFAPKLSRLEDAFAGIGVDTVASTLSVRIPDRIGLADGLAAMFGAAAVATFQPIFAAAALGVGIVKVARAARKSARERVEQSPTALLLFASEELTPQSMFDRLTVNVRHVALGT
jgi:hypothetical protein